MSENTQQKNGFDLSLFSPEEREIITAVTKNFGRELTAKEINWSLAQARAIGALPKNEETWAQDLASCAPKRPSAT